MALFKFCKCSLSIVRMQFFSALEAFEGNRAELCLKHRRQFYRAEHERNEKNMIEKRDR